MGWFSGIGKSLGDLFSAPVDAVKDTFSGDLGGAVNDFLKPGEDLMPFGLGDKLQDNIINPVENFIGNNYQFGLDQLHRFGNQFKENPFGFIGETALGAGTPLGSWAWNTLTGDNTKPLVTMLGGPTDDTFKYSQSRGTNTEDAGYVSTIANLIAGAEAGSWAGGALGGVADVGSEASAGSSALSDAAGSTSGGGFGSSEAAYDASQIPGWTSTGGGAYGATVRGVGNGATRGAINALDNNSNVLKGTAYGAIGGGLGSNVDFAGMGGIDDPLYKGAINGAITGGLKATMSDSNAGYGALVGALGNLGSQGLNAVGNYFSSPTTGDSSLGSSGVSNLGNLATGLGNLWLAHRNASGINSQINSLNSLYAPNSAYAKQMQQTLDRQDAAGGRRSQYGTRAVELQAALANAASRNAPTLANLYSQQRANNFNQFAGLLTMGKNSGLFGSLGNMYNNYKNNSYSPVTANASDFSQLSPSAVNQSVMDTVPNDYYGG